MTLQELQSLLDDYTRKGSNIVSKVPIIGGMSRLQRYPQEIGRVLSSSAGLGIADLLGIDNEGTRKLRKDIQKPMYMSEEEWNRSLGTDNLGTQLLESVSVGAEVPKAAFLFGKSPLGKVDKGVSNLLGGESATGFGKVFPWLGGKAAAGGSMGLLSGVSTMPVERPRDIPGYLGKSSAIGAGTNIAIGGIQEALKGLRGLGTRTSARAKGMAQKGDTTAQMGKRLEGAKGQEGTAATAQGQIDKGVQKANELTGKKIEALNKAKVSDLNSLKNSIKESFKKSVAQKIGKTKLMRDPLYNDILNKIDSAQSLQELDDIAVEAGNQVRTIGGAYNPEGSLEKQLYDTSRGTIVEALKGVSKNYDAAKSALSDVLSRINSKEMISKAFLENKGMGAPLVVAGSEVPIPRSLWSLLGSTVGGIEQGLGKLGESDLARRLGTMGITEVASEIGQGNKEVAQTLETKQEQPQETPGNVPPGLLLGSQLEQQFGVQASPQGFGGGLSGTQPMGPLGAQAEAEPQRVFDMERFSNDVMQAMLAGQISPAQAEYSMQLAQNMAGGQSIADQIAQVAQTDPKAAQQLLAQAVISGQIDRNVASTYADLMGMGGQEKLSTGALNARSAWEDLQQIDEQLEGGQKPVGWKSILPKEGGDPELQALDNAVRNITDTIARTRTGAAMNIKEEELYKDFAPTVWDTEESRINKIERLERLFRLVMENEGVDVDALNGGSLNGSIADQYQY